MFSFRCVECGSPFISKHPIRKYCSRECYRKSTLAIRRIAKRKQYREATGTTICQRCGETAVELHRKKYCSAKCAKLARLENQQKYKIQRRLQNGGRLDCIFCGQPLGYRQISFCSHSCKRYYYRRTQTSQCFVCGENLPLHKQHYCSSKCLREGLRVARRKYKHPICVVCGKKCNGRRTTYCGDKCYKHARKHKFDNVSIVENSASDF